MQHTVTSAGQAMNGLWVWWWVQSLPRASFFLSHLAHLSHNPSSTLSHFLPLLSTTSMRFSFSVAALALAALSSALPTTPEVTLARRVAGPSGSVITPVGETSYSVGDAIDFVYHRSIEKGSQTDSLNIVLKTFDTLDGVEYSANVITVKCLSPSSEHTCAMVLPRAATPAPKLRPKLRRLLQSLTARLVPIVPRHQGSKHHCSFPHPRASRPRGSDVLDRP